MIFYSIEASSLFHDKYYTKHTPIHRLIPINLLPLSLATNQSISPTLQFSESAAIELTLQGIAHTNISIIFFSHFLLSRYHVSPVFINKTPFVPYQFSQSQPYDNNTIHSIKKYIQSNALMPLSWSAT
jgi:hypothetical protein